MRIQMFFTCFSTVMIRKYSLIYALKWLFLCLIFKHPEIKYPQKVLKPQNRDLETFKNSKVTKLNTRKIFKNP